MPNIVSEITEIFIYKKVGRINKFLLLKRNESEIYAGIWSIAGGRIEEGEKIYEAAKREMMEETGLEPVHFYSIDIVNGFYAKDKDTINLVPVFLAEAGSQVVKLSSEHSEYLWLDYENALEKIYWISWKQNLKVINEVLNDKELFKTLIEI